MRSLTLLHCELSPAFRYGLAIAMFLGALLLRFALLPGMSGFPYLTLFPATVASFYLCGPRPGLLVTVLSAAAGAYFFISPDWLFFNASGGYFMVGVFLAGALLTAVVVNQLQKYARNLHHAMTRLQDSERRFRSFMDNGHFMSWMKDREGRHIYINQQYEQRFEIPPNSWLGKLDFDFFPPEIAQRFIDSDQQVLASLHPFVTEEITIDRHGNTNYWFTTKFPYTDSSGNLFIGGVAIDITERKAAEAKIENLAFYDPLTGLPNRRLLMDRIAHVIANASRHQHLGALLFIDLDNFKTLNDTLGHDHGDMLLQMVAQRLSAGLRKGDTLARFGGDEFVVLIENLSPNALEAAARAETLGEKILATLAQPYQLGNTAHRSTPSIGITLIGETEETVEEPLKRADLAMYQAKSAGRNTLRFFDPEIQTAIATRSQMEMDLRTAIAQQQLFLVFQPQMSGAIRLTGVEALVRWRHPARGIIPPVEFIPLAEETGLIIALGGWVLNEACAQLARWAKQPDMAHLTIAVNVSPRQFHQTDFVEQVLAALAATGANPQRLKLELTEGLLVSNMEDIIAKMSRLKSEGVGFSLDDFGTGYSSLAYLKQLPLDQLKIDQSFVRDILIDPNDAAIAKTIIALAESLGLAVIAEGVETEAQRNFLVELGCPNYQGYLCSRPLPVAEFETYFKKSMAPATPTT